MAIALIDIYRFSISGILGGRCRFTPTCACYARDSFRHLGFFRGLMQTVRRLSRCHPWGGYGYEPVLKPEFGDKK